MMDDLSCGVVSLSTSISKLPDICRAVGENVSESKSDSALVPFTAEAITPVISPLKKVRAEYADVLCIGNVSTNKSSSVMLQFSRTLTDC